MSGEPTLDVDTLDQLLEMTGGDLEFLDELIDTYLDDAVTQLGALGVAAGAGDVAGMVRPAHSLKSSSASVGAAALTELSRTLEADGHAGAVPDAVARVAAANGEFERVRTALLAARAAR